MAGLFSAVGLAAGDVFGLDLVGVPPWVLPSPLPLCGGVAPLGFGTVR
jgi:hypothetical protein